MQSSGDKFGCDFPIVKRIALTEEQIQYHRLPTRPTKRVGNTHAHTFTGDSVELDALPSSELRNLVRECIERHINPHAVATLRATEESEREFIEALTA